MPVRSIRYWLCSGGEARTELGGHGTFVLVDAHLTGGASSHPAIINQSTMWVRNITQSGYGKAIDNQSGSGFDQSGTHVDEWSSHAVEKLWTNSIDESLNLPVRNTPEIPWDDLSDWGKWNAFGGSTDTEKLQNAIHGGKSTIYIPNGDMPVIDGTVYIRGKVRRIIGCEDVMKGVGVLKCVNGEHAAVIIERIEGEAQGSWAPSVEH